MLTKFVRLVAVKFCFSNLLIAEKTIQRAQQMALGLWSLSALFMDLIVWKWSSWMRA